MRSWHHLSWNQLKSFYRIAQVQSFTKAGEKLNLNQSAVSRQMILLEEDLQLKPFTRQSRKPTVLTSQGRILYETVGKMAALLKKTLNVFEEDKIEPQGVLRVSLPSAFFALCFLPL